MSWKTQVIEQYSDLLNENIDDAARFLKNVLDDRMVEKLAEGAERFAAKLRQKEEPLQ